MLVIHRQFIIFHSEKTNMQSTSKTTVIHFRESGMGQVNGDQFHVPNP